MANLSQIKTDSDWGLEASKINQNFNQINTEVTTLKNTTSVRQPLFSSTSEASKNITSPYVGQLVLIGSTIPAPIYRWNGSSWVNTGQTGGSAEVSLTNYYTKADIDNQRTELESKIGGVGYITCETVSGTAAKTITLTGLTALSTGIRLLVKMTNANTASNATLNINSFGAKPLFYNNKRVSTDNTWVAGEVIDIYYDGTNFYSSNVQGGSGASGNIILEWNTDAATTRKQVKQSERKTLLQISYKNSEGNTVNEQYIGTAYTDTEWAKDSNWKKNGDIPNDLKELQLAEILDKAVNTGYRIEKTGTETKDGAYNHVSFEASSSDVIIFRGGKAANVYTNFLLIEKTDGSYESLTYRSQYDNTVSTAEVSLKAYADIKKVHYNDDASSPLELYKTSTGIAYYALSKELKNTFSCRTNYYQSAVNVLDPNDSEARKDGYYNNMNVFTPDANYQGITVPVEFGNTYFVIKNNGSIVKLNSSQYPILYLDSNKDIIQVNKIGTAVEKIFIDDVRCKFLRFSIVGMQSTTKLGVVRNSKKYVEYGEASEPNVLKDFGKKSVNIFDWDTMLEGKSIRMSGYQQALTMGMVKIPVQRGKTYAIGIYPDFNMYLTGESNFQEDAIGILTSDNKTLGTIVRFRDLKFNAACTNFIYEVESSYLLDGQSYEGDIFLCFNTNAKGVTANIQVTGIVVQEGENVTTSYAKNFFKSNELKSIYSVSHLHLGDSNSFGFGVPDNTKCVNRYLGSAFMDMQYGVVNKGVSASPIGLAYNQVVELGERLKYFKIISVMHGTNCYMAENAKESATIPKESYADIPYQTEEGAQISTIEDHCARFGSDTYSTYCKFIEYCLYINQTALLTFISIPAFAKDTVLENKRKTTNAVIKEICETYAIPFIDAANNAGISSRSMNRYSTDGTHLSTEEANYKWWGYVSKQLRVLSMDIFGKELIASIKENY